MSNYTTCTEDAAAVSAALKAKGLGRKHVSVRSDQYSMGSSLRIRVLDPAVRIADVRAIAETKERIDRDQFGEILSGGNRFVFVEYDYTVEKVLAASWLSRVEAAIAQVSGNSIVPVQDTPYGVAVNAYGAHSLWDISGVPGGHIQGGEAHTLAYSIGARLGLAPEAA